MSSSISRRPRWAARRCKDQPYGEVESVKAVSDVIAPLSGEILEVNQKAVDEPEVVNDDPYGDGWLVRIRLSDRSSSTTLMDAAAYTRARRPSNDRRVPLADRARPRGDARGDRRRSIDELFAQIPAAFASTASSTSRRA